MKRAINGLKLFSSSGLFFKVAARISFSLFLAFISISMFVRDSREIQNSIKSGLPALDEWYYQKIYHFSKSFIYLDQPFVDNVDFSYRNIETLNFGDLFYKIIFKFFPYDISISYFVSTTILLSLWIYLISILVMNSRKNYFFSTAILSLICIIMFFGNSRLPNNDYPFARVVSPQFVGLVWILATLLIFNEIDNKSRLSESNGRTLFAFSFLLFFASFTYLYLFLSIFGALLVRILSLIKTKTFKKALTLFMSIVAGTLPYLISNSHRLEETRFTEASLRMGLIESRSPGGGLTIILCLSCILILNSSKITKLNFQNSISKTLSLTSLGILVASQSNLFTNISIQFSYHFEIFAWLNFLIIVSLILIKLFNRISCNMQTKTYKNILIIFCLIVLVIYNFTVKDLNSSKRELKTIQKTIQMKFGDDSNLIVDAKGLQSSFRIYSKSRILYQEDIIPYGYTNKEILERFFISSGCSNNLTDDVLLKPLVYYIEGSNQKGESLKKYLRLINLENQFRFLYQPLIEAAQDRRVSAIEFINFLKLEFQPNSCLELARNKGINFIIFDKNSKWSEILNPKSIVRSDLGLKDIYFSRI